MQAWMCKQFEGVDSLVWQDVELAAPGKGDVRIAIKACSLNFPDLLLVQGKYQARPSLPFIPGSEFAGIVESVGEGVKHLVPGMHVAAFYGVGGFATHAVVPASVVMPLPPAFTFEDAASFLCTYGTSYHGLMDRAQLKAGETVLVLGAAGGVGTAAIQISKAAGAKIIAAASSDEKCALCTSLGAHATINYSEQNLRDELQSLTGGRGPDVVYDPVGGALTELALRSIAWRGRHLMIGFASSDVPALPLNLPLLRGASVLGVFWGEFAKREPAANAANLMQLGAWYLEGKIKPVIHAMLPLSQIKDGFAMLDQRKVQGKVVLSTSL